MKNLQILPSLLHRVSPLPLEHTNLLRSEKLTEFFEEHKVMEPNIETLCEKIDAVLFETIQTCEEPKDRNKLLNAKRSIHHRKNLKAKEEKVLRQYLNAEEMELIETYKKAGQSILQHQSNGEQLFGTELQKTREQFQKLIKSNTAFSKSLQLSSQSLFSQLEDYLGAEPYSLKKTLVNAEFSLLKYLTRQYTKTSPFSRFTCLSMGERSTGQHLIRSTTRINNNLLPYIKGLMAQVPAIASRLPVKLNPTLESAENEFRYLVNFNNVEVFQRINRSASLEHILSYIDGKATIAHLCQRLSEDFEGVKPVEIQSHLFQLVDIGLIELNINISGTDPEWSTKFVAFLNDFAPDNPDLKILQIALEHLQTATESFSMADIPKRQKILNEAHNVLKTGISLFCETHQLPYSERDANRKAKDDFLKLIDQDVAFRIRHFNGFYFSPENLFYEDASTSYDSPFDAENVQPLADKLDRLYRTLSPLFPINEENKKQYHFFQEHYPEASEVPLMHFYEDYYKNFLKPNKESENGQTLPSIQAELERKRSLEHQFKKRFVELVQSKNTGDEQLDFSERELKAVFGKEALQNASYSKGAHVQLYRNENEETVGVLNSVFNGYGRGYGRFLHLFPEEYTEVIRQQNRDFFPDCLMAEIKDASCFNANIHPPLLPSEIVISGGNTNLPEKDQLNVQDLVVFCEEGTIQLMHRPTGKRVLPYDLCLQTTKSRSELYQLLVAFTPSVPFSIYALQNWLYEQVESGDENEVVAFPRVVYEDQLVLFRKCWKVAKSSLPEDAPHVSDFEYWFQLEAWRSAYNIPRHCFVFITATHKGAGNNATFDDYKPQYIDFESPLLVRLFRKATRKANRFIRIEEMLPNKEQVNQGHVSETLVQWYTTVEEPFLPADDSQSTFTLAHNNGTH